LFLENGNMATINRLSFLLATLIWLTVCAALELGGEGVLQPAVEPARIPARLPGDDEWYRPPNGFENQPPGTILKYRRAPRGLSLNNKDKLGVKDTWQILYRTQNSVKEPEATVVTLAVPNSPDTKKLFFYNWFSVRCSFPPST
jgi:hypothetical protein